jgi:hypothetical protein
VPPESCLASICAAREKVLRFSFSVRVCLRVSAVVLISTSRLTRTSFSSSATSAYTQFIHSFTGLVLEPPDPRLEFF